MSRFEAWALPSVREEAIRLAVESAGMRWDCCSHVTATRSLQRSIVESGRAAVAIEIGRASCRERVLSLV